MKCIRISPVSGLYHEFYGPLYKSLNFYDLQFNKNELDATNLFWSLILEEKNIRKAITKVQPVLPKYIAVLGNIELFLSQVELAKKNICSRTINQKDFFCYLETLSIVCSIYSDYVFSPHRITVQNGFELAEFSAREIYENCLQNTENPYLCFVKSYVMPLIKKQSPELIFIEGKPTYYNMCICRLIKEELPKTHISLTHHSSEYYSINKLEEYLVNNTYLFKMVDSIILEYFDKTEKILFDALQNNQSLSNVCNLVYKDERGITKTQYDFDTLDFVPTIQQVDFEDQLINVHLQPYVMCYWNKCTFCGINKKYHFNSKEYGNDTLGISLNLLKKQLHNRLKYIWFIDEAIHPFKLNYIATFLLENNIHICWQARCRIEKELLDQHLILQLKKSGLKELRLGLESASISTLKAMNKFDSDFSLKLVDEICSQYNRAGISIHFPIIIGFPGESAIERKMTFDFLNDLCFKYNLVSFNINVFNLDIRSYVYKYPQKFGINEIFYPCELNDFLENTLKWNRNDDEQILFRERDNCMRDILYPWMPSDSFVKPYLFYRLSETIRNTLVWKSKQNQLFQDEFDQTVSFDKEKLVIPNTLIYTYDSERSIYIIYNWYTHHYMIGNRNIVFIFELFKMPYSISEAIQKLVSFDSVIYISDDLKKLLNKLYQQGYLIKYERKEEHHEY